MANGGAEEEGLPGPLHRVPKRTRHWLLTLFMSPRGVDYEESVAEGDWPADLDLQLRACPWIRFWVGQIEDTAKSPEDRARPDFEPHLHLQAYIQSRDPITLLNAKRRLVQAGLSDKVHLELCRGTPQECIDYCTKLEGRVVGTLPFEFGKPVLTSGERTDWEQLKDDVKGEFKDDKFFFENHTSLMVKHGAGIQAMRNAFHTHSGTVKRTFTIYWGVAGAGKSYAAVMAARAKAEELKCEYYIYRPDIEKASKVWQCKYGHQRVLVWNEFDDMEISKGWLCSFFDGSQVDFPAKNVKGGIDIKADHIYLTSNVDPADWFPKIQPREALWRRLKEHCVMKQYTKPYPGVKVDRPVPNEIIDYDELMDQFGEHKAKDEFVLPPLGNIPDHQQVLAQDPMFDFEEGLSQHEIMSRRARNICEMGLRGAGSGVSEPGSQANPMQID